MDNTTPPQIPTESVRQAYSKHSDLIGHGTQYVRASASCFLVILGTLPVLVAGEGKNVSGGAPIQFALEKSGRLSTTTRQSIFTFPPTCFVHRVECRRTF